MANFQRAADEINNADALIVTAGAGMGVDSDLPDFRGSSGFWKWRHSQGDVILGCVRWYCKYGISYRELEEMMLERGFEVDHTTLYRGVQHFAPEMEKRLRWYYKPTMGFSWRVDVDLYKGQREMGVFVPAY